MLTHDRQFFNEMEQLLRKCESTDIQLFEESLELINNYLRHYAQLVILDIDVLKEEILNMIQILRAIHREARIVLFLSPENMPICSSALTLGVSSYQLKPISAKTATDIITSVLHIQFNRD